MKIKSRDVAFFFLGVFFLITINAVLDWEGTKEAYNEAYRNARFVESPN
ncbi:hypothetical protein LB452_08705 [Psychroflexus sp. CAK8W]|uniref:Uncharacterized protein n=1 Tax=Psychroflexus longus TaxID=2873596 RepID=A0ABS7XM94_9FLAO|nr:hypothetical protein [Psychroflexus longus]MBZ9779001.1 hypothetical protein [Psychroflexus longus]